MNEGRTGRDGDGVLALVRETVDGLGRLVSEHVKLARLELQADIKVYGRSVGALLAVVAVFSVGYLLACIGLCIFLGRWLGAAGGFFAVAGGHALLGALTATIAGRHLRETRPMQQTVAEVSRSVSALTAAGSSHATAGAPANHRAVAVRAPAPPTT